MKRLACLCAGEKCLSCLRAGEKCVGRTSWPRFDRQLYASHQLGFGNTTMEDHKTGAGRSRPHRVAAARLKISMWLAALGMVSVAAVDAAAAPSFFVLQPVDGYTQSTVAALAGNGQVVVGASSKELVATAATKWEVANPSAPFRLPELSAGVSDRANAVSADGSVILGTAFPPGSASRAVLWTNTGVQPVPLSSEVSDSPNSVFTYAHKLSRDGTVAVGWELQGNGAYFGFRSTGGTTQPLKGAPGQNYTLAAAISGDATTIIGGQTDPLSGVVWRAQSDSSISSQTINLSPGQSLRSLSADGSIAGGFGSTPFYIPDFQNCPSSCTTVDVPFDSSFLFSNGALQVISLSNDIFLGSVQISGESHAWIWVRSEPTAQLLTAYLTSKGLGGEIAGWKLTSVVGISDDGLVLAGSGYDPKGKLRGWVVRLDPPTPVPEPATVAIVLIGLIGLAAARVHRLA